MAQIINLQQSVSVKEAERIVSKFKKTGDITPQDFKAVEAAIFGYSRLSYTRNWAVTLRTPTKTIMQGCAVLARAEGNINHALSLEERIPHLPKNSRYRAGRSKNGCSTGEVVIRR